MTEQTRSILDFWPVTSPPRKTQIQALQWLEKQTARYLFVEAPIGCGKSYLALTFAQYLKGYSFILTPQRILQAQYEREVKNRPDDDHWIGSFYGRSNYPCGYKHTDCHIGGLAKPQCQTCPYESAKEWALLSRNVVLNYKLALVSFAYTGSFPRRSLCIFDECHNLEAQLVDFDTINVTSFKCGKFHLPWDRDIKSFEGAHEWVQKTYYPQLMQKYADFIRVHGRIITGEGRHKGDTTPLTEFEKNVLRDYHWYKEHIEKISIINNNDLPILKQEFVFVREPDNINKPATTVRFKRLKGAHSFHRILDKMASRFLFMSSTILDYKAFCDDLEIDPNDAAFLSVDSEFPIENRPIYYMPKMNMKYGWEERKDELASLLNFIISLIQQYPDDKGIIHTGNFRLSRWLVKGLEQARKQGRLTHGIYHHNAAEKVESDSDEQEKKADRNYIIEGFQDDQKPCILISPSITEGLDLVEDKGRFAIFLKVPYQALGDAWVKARQVMSQKWYNRQALTAIIQGSGRIVRSSSDYGDTYILDECFGGLYNRSQGMIPKWWDEALIMESKS